MGSRRFDLLVIGAGLSGIISAQRYLDIHPGTEVAILERESDVGGVFTKRRGFDNFWTQWKSGLNGFSDLPMEQLPSSEHRDDFYNSRQLTEYLQKYVDRELNSKTLRDRIFFNSKAISITKFGALWKVLFTDTKGNMFTFSATKIIVATGLSSRPHVPTFCGSDTFGAPIIHSIDFGSHISLLRSSPPNTRITVLGGGKSAVDMVYECAKAGKKVEWIIRPSGKETKFPRPKQGPFRSTPEAAANRFVSAVEPSIFNPDTAWSAFLQQNKFGNHLMRRKTVKPDKGYRKEARLNARMRQESHAIRKLEYKAPLFWQQHHSDFFSIAKHVVLHADNIAALSPGTIHLESGQAIPCDTLLCGTGWEPSLPFFDNKTSIQLGLPHSTATSSLISRVKWSTLDSEADRLILEELPLLAESPTSTSRPDETISPYRLYQGMAPIHENSILFTGHLHTDSKLFSAEAQAIWAVAFFDGNVKLPPVAEMERHIARWVAYIRRRYGTSGSLGNNITMDTIPYVDRLLEEIGLQSPKKGKGWRKYWFDPVGPKDIGKAWDEYRTLHREKTTLG